MVVLAGLVVAEAAVEDRVAAAVVAVDQAVGVEAAGLVVIAVVVIAVYLRVRAVALRPDKHG